jgi:hypothetical protein
VTEDRLVKNFNTGFWTFLIISIVCVVLGVVFLIIRNKILALPKIKPSYKIIYYVFIGALFVGSIACLIFFVPYARDKKAVDNRQFITITGTVTDFDETYYGDFSQPTHSNPTVRNEETGETVKLKISHISSTEIQKGETYTFIYFEHTKLGAVKTG